MSIWLKQDVPTTTVAGPRGCFAGETYHRSLPEELGLTLFREDILQKAHGIPLFLLIPRAEHPESRLKQVDLPTSNSRKTHHWAGPAPKAISSEERGGSILADASLLTPARAPGE